MKEFTILIGVTLILLGFGLSGLGGSMIGRGERGGSPVAGVGIFLASLGGYTATGALV